MSWQQMCLMVKWMLTDSLSWKRDDIWVLGFSRRSQAICRFRFLCCYYSKLLITFLFWFSTVSADRIALKLIFHTFQPVTQGRKNNLDSICCSNMNVFKPTSPTRGHPGVIEPKARGLAEGGSGIHHPSLLGMRRQLTLGTVDAKMGDLRDTDSTPGQGTRRLSGKDSWESLGQQGDQTSQS